ncbi:MAG: hypothetical protein ACYC8S_00190 [Minisyncoccota bacterium]
MSSDLLAASHGTQDVVGVLISEIENAVLNPLVTLLFVAAVVYFFWGVSQFIFNYDSDERRSDGKRHMFWGVIGIAIMALAQVFIMIIANTIGVHTP